MLYLHRVQIKFERSIGGLIKFIEAIVKLCENTIKIHMIWSILKEYATSISNALSALFNKSIELGAVPAAWKKMKILPVFKNGKRTSITQYRPIAKPSCLGKIQDKLMTIRLNAMIRDEISIHQHEFVKKRNTSTSILELTQLGFDAFEHNVQVDIFYADFSNAFDKVKHSKLIKKLAALGVSKYMLKWIWSFLKNRT